MSETPAPSLFTIPGVFSPGSPAPSPSAPLFGAPPAVPLQSAREQEPQAPAAGAVEEPRAEPQAPFAGCKPEDLIKAFLGGWGGACDIRIMARLMAAVSTTNYYLQHMNSSPMLTAGALREYAMKQREPKGGLVLEFGVNRGGTLRQLASLTDGPVYGFDAFRGLPDNWKFGAGKGMFAGHTPKDLPANARLVVGWFADTLPGFLREHPGQAALVHVDCDIYSSTCDVLNALEARIGPGTVIVFDEYYNYPQWEQHEFRAWQEFVHRRGVQYEYIAVDPGGQQVCVRVLANGAFRA